MTTKQQNARCISTSDEVFVGKCHVCGAGFGAPWRGPDDVPAWLKAWRSFVWRHEGCDLEPLPAADESWLRPALESIR